MSNDVYYDYFEEKRKVISEFALEQYQRDGKLSGKALLRESCVLDEVINKKLLEDRLKQYGGDQIPAALMPGGTV